MIRFHGLNILPFHLFISLSLDIAKPEKSVKIAHSVENDCRWTRLLQWLVQSRCTSILGGRGVPVFGRSINPIWTHHVTTAPPPHFWTVGRLCSLHSSSMKDHLMMMLSVRLSQSHKKGQNMYFWHGDMNNYLMNYIFFLYKNRLWCRLP